jgi:hypothetical protein
MSAPILVGAETVKGLSQELSRLPASGGLESPGSAPDSLADIHRDLPEAIAVLESIDRKDGVMVISEHRLASLLQSFLAERGLAEETDLLAKGRLTPTPAGGLEATFDRHDVRGWVFDFLPAYLKGRFAKRSFVIPGDSVATIGEGDRLALLGDWGTGLYGAPVCADSIRRARPAFAAVIHLGDVYYAGTTPEVRARFLELWPRGARHNWALNANHEMYSGGEGYFDTTLRDPLFATQQSSCFAFQSARFLFLGLDSAYEEADLTAAQLSWIARRIAAADGRSVVLLSHHQPYSPFERAGAKLLAKLRPWLDAGQIFAWYWGHEHRCTIFDRHEALKLWGRCIGHSGYPAFRDAHPGQPEQRNSDESAWFRVTGPGLPAALVLDGPNRYVMGHEAQYAPNGYLSLTIDGDRLHEVIHAPDGTALLERELARR